MDVQVVCPTCRLALEVPESSLGQQVSCPQCRTAFTARDRRFEKDPGGLADGFGGKHDNLFSAYDVPGQPPAPIAEAKPADVPRTPPPPAPPKNAAPTYPPPGFGPPTYQQPSGFGPAGNPPPTGYPPPAGYAPPYGGHYGQQYPQYAQYSTTSQPANKVAAGLMGILFGGFGIHKFMLGYTNAGVVMLLVSLIGGIFTCGLSTAIMGLIGFVEGIIYLTKSDQDFRQTYVAQRKEWF
jgi:TM2 domain-containing membrane protein YozV